jgi:hypothetical protein
MSGSLRVLASGVDGMELSARGVVRPDLWGRLELAKREARELRTEMPFTWPGTHQTFLMQPGDLHGQPYWLRSGDYELRIGRPVGRVPVYTQLHSAYVHERGPEMAAGLVGTLLQVDVMKDRFELIGSRVDLYADVQGWRFELSDHERFVARGRARRGYLKAEDGEDQVFSVGREVTMFRFGRDAVVARIYDKTREMRRRPVSWLPDVWGEKWDQSEPVWRVEFQIRRKALGEFNLLWFDEMLASVQDLWNYGTHKWLTLRVRTENRQRTRWPLDESWRVVQSVRLGPQETGVVRRRVIEANEEMTVRVLQGSLSSWAAVKGIADLDGTLRALRPRLARYYKETKGSFVADVQHKRARLLAMNKAEEGGRSSAQDGEVRGGDEPKAREEGLLPRSGATRPVGRRPEGARGRQSTFLARPAEDTTGADAGEDRTVSAEPVSGRESERGWLEAQRNGEAATRRGDGGESDARRDGRRQARGTEGEAKQPGEDGRAHHRGHEEDGGGRGDGGGRAKASVGAEPPPQPGGSERNRFRGGRVGTARQRGTGRRGPVSRRGRSKSGRRAGRRASVATRGLT